MSAKYTHTVKLLQENHQKDGKQSPVPNLGPVFAKISQISEKINRIPETQTPRISDVEEFEIVEHLLQNQEKLFKKISEFQLQIAQKSQPLVSAEVTRNLKKIALI